MDYKRSRLNRSVVVYHKEVGSIYVAEEGNDKENKILRLEQNLTGPNHAMRKKRIWWNGGLSSHPGCAL
jgi:hypothetical protein